jgi:hypothetical protein
LAEAEARRMLRVLAVASRKDLAPEMDGALRPLPDTR